MLNKTIIIIIIIIIIIMLGGEPLLAVTKFLKCVNY